MDRPIPALRAVGTDLILTLVLQHILHWTKKMESLLPPNDQIQIE